jgi:hypothetical protein
MSNEEIDLCRLYVTKFFHPAPAVAGGPGIWAAFVTWDAEVYGTSSQASIWCSSLPDGARTASGSRQFVTNSPTVNWPTLTQMPGASGDELQGVARERAAIQLLNQLLGTLPAGVVYPGGVWPVGGDHNA